MKSAVCVLVMGMGLVGIWVGSSSALRHEVGPRKDPTISPLGDRFFGVKAFSAKRALVIGYGGRILETTDGGRTWGGVPTPTRRALYDISFGDPPDHRVGWVSGEAGILLRTTDGGRTWTQQESNTEMPLFAIHALTPLHAYAVGDRSVLLQTMDGGATWEVRKVPLPRDGLTEAERIVMQDPVLYGVTFTDMSHGWVVGEFGTIQHTADGGQTWEAQQMSLLSETRASVLDLPTFFGVAFSDAREGIAAGLEGGIVRTRDGGVTWAFELVDEAVAVRDPLYAPFLSADGTGWVIGSSGEVVTVAPGRSVWTRAALGMEIHTWLRGIDFFDRHHGWIVGGFGTILTTRDGGNTWTTSYG